MKQMINWKPEALQEAVDAWFGYQVNLSTEIAKQINKALNAAVEAQGDLEIDYWKNRTREALETIKDNVARIAELELDCEMRRVTNYGQSQTIDNYNKRIDELQQIIARIVEHNDINSDVPEYIRWEILVADARKAAADWKAQDRALGEKE